MGHIYGFLKYLGTPYNLKKKPATLQILLFFLALVLCLAFFWAAWKHSNLTFVGLWYTYLFSFLLNWSETTAVIFFSAKNLRPRHPLISIVEELTEIMESEDMTHHSSWFYLGLGINLPYLLIMLNYTLKHERELFKLIPAIFNMVKELTMSMHLAQVLEPLHVIVSIISQIRARLHAYSHEPDSNQSKRILELIIIERKLEVVLNQLIEEYGKDIIRIFYISTGRMTLSLSTSLIFLIPERYGDFFFLIPVFLFLIIANMYRVWSVADAAQFVRYQMERFHSELYTVSLEYKTQELAKNELLSVFLERGPPHVSFKVDGFFVLDRSLFCRMLSAAVTWVFIIIQFIMRDRCGLKHVIPI